MSKQRLLPEMIVEYTLYVEVIEREGYTNLHQHREINTITLPAEAYGALDLNAVAASMVKKCAVEVEQEKADEKREADSEALL